MSRQDAGATERALRLKVGVFVRAAIGRQDAGATVGMLAGQKAFF